MMRIYCGREYLDLRKEKKKEGGGTELHKYLDDINLMSNCTVSVSIISYL
jgi:hypothetical protein